MLPMAHSRLAQIAARIGCTIPVLNKKKAEPQPQNGVVAAFDQQRRSVPRCKGDDSRSNAYPRS